MSDDAMAAEAMGTMTQEVPADPEAAKAEWFKELKEKFGDSAPTPELLDAWKAQAKRVRVVAFSENEIYIFRALKGAEYRSMVQQVTATDATNVQQQNELLKEKVVTAAVLFPKIDPTETGALFAGTIDALFEMVRQASNFVTQEEATMMVREL